MAIAKSFVMGILAAAGALIFEISLSIVFPDLLTPENLYLAGNALALISLAAIEEFFIFFMIQKIVNDFRDEKKIWLMAMICGGGFAFFELALRFMDNETEAAFLNPGYLGIFIIHILTAGFFGYFLSKRTCSPFFKLFLLIAATAIHFTYNYLIVFYG